MKRAWGIFQTAIFICLTIIISATLTGCDRLTPVDKATKEAHLILGNGSDPATLDPSLSTGTVEHKILNALFEGLVCADSKTLEIKPAVANAWEISRNGLQCKVV